MDIAYANGLFYVSSGDVIDVANPDVPSKAGAFTYSGNSVLPLGTAGSRVLMLSSDWPEPLTLRLLDTSTFTQVDVATYPGVEPHPGWNLVSTDGKTLAFIAASVDGPRTMYVLPNPFGE